MTRLGFHLYCSTDNGTTCPGVRVCCQDQNGDCEATVVASDVDGVWTDQSGNGYECTFDGKNVLFASVDGSGFIGCWIQGGGEMKGIKGGGSLSSRFDFTFSDYGGGNQRLNANWTFSGSSEDAVDAWVKAGYRVSWLDNRFNKGYRPPVGGSLIHMRTSGHFLSGADSGHAIVDIHPTPSLSARGVVHVGEHNPTTPLGFILHQTETAQKAAVAVLVPRNVDEVPAAIDVHPPDERLPKVAADDGAYHDAGDRPYRAAVA